MGPVKQSKGGAARRKPTPPNALGAAIAAWNNKARESVSPILAHIHGGIRALHQVQAELRHYGEMSADLFSQSKSAPQDTDPVPTLRTLCKRLDDFEEALGQVSAQARAVCGQGEGLVRDYLSLLAQRPPEAESSDVSAAQMGPADGSNSDADLEEFSGTRALEKLVEAQKAEIAVLHTLLAETRAKLAEDAHDSQPDLPQAAPSVEIQSVQDFVQNSPIATVPINASYYSRILEAANAPEGHRVPMGEILMNAGLITKRQLKNALAHQQDGRRKPLGVLLVDLGYTSEQAIAQTVAAQLALPYVVLARETIREGAVALVPLRVARLHSCFPLNYNDHALTVAMANPLDLVALEDLHKVSEKHIRPCVASREDIVRHIRIHYA